MGISIGSGIGGSGIGSSGIGGSSISGSSFSPLDLSPVSWLTSRISTLYQDSAGATPVTAAGQDVGKRDDQSGNARNMTQATATARPTYEGDRLEYDVDDALSCTLPAISGGQIVIISPAGTWIDDFDFAGGTFTVGPNTYTGGPAGLMALLGNEEIEIIILPTPMTTAEQAKMVAYAQGLGSAGLITFGDELLGDPSFDDSAYWTQPNPGVAYVTGGQAVFASAATGQNINRPGAPTLGKTYLCGVTVSSRTSGAVRVSPSVGTGSASMPDISAAGSYRGLVSASGTFATFQMTAINSTTLSIDSATLREVIMP